MENDAFNKSPIVACFRWDRNVSTEPLPSNDRGDTHTDTQTYAVEMGSSGMIYIPSFIKIDSGIKFNKGKYTDSKVIS
jgi:hypothetical protein